MSLILEALKKSEAERRAGELPVVLSERAYVPHRERPIWPVFAAFVVLVGLAGAYVNRSLLWPERFPPATEEGAVAHPATLPEGSYALNDDPAPLAPPAELNATESSAPPTPASASNLGNAPADSAPLASPSPALAMPPVPEQSVPAPAATSAPAPAPALADMNDPPPSFPTPPMTPDQLAPPAEPMASTEAAATASTGPAADSLPVPEIAAAPPGPTQAPAEAPAQAQAQAQASSALPDFQSLPYATRQAMPALKVSLFVFHQDPNRRFIIVNGARLQEGGVVGEEAWLREIRQDGAVFEFRGERFLLRRQGG